MGNAPLATTIGFSATTLFHGTGWYQCLKNDSALWSWMVTALKLWTVKCEDECEEWTLRNSYKYLSYLNPNKLGRWLCWYTKIRPGLRHANIERVSLEFPEDKRKVGYWNPNHVIFILHEHDMSNASDRAPSSQRIATSSPKANLKNVNTRLLYALNAFVCTRPGRN